jgi:methylglyoxal synthase
MKLIYEDLNTDTGFLAEIYHDPASKVYLAFVQTEDGKVDEQEVFTGSETLDDAKKWCAETIQENKRGPLCGSRI